MTDDIIRIDGVEYDATELLKTVIRMNFEPKRKQTGWICHGCEQYGPCVIMGRTSRPLFHMGCCAEADYQPFYGKVVE